MFLFYLHKKKKEVLKNNNIYTIYWSLKNKKVNLGLVWTFFVSCNQSGMVFHEKPRDILDLRIEAERIYKSSKTLNPAQGCPEEGVLGG